MKTLHTVTAFLEIVAGVALVCCPSATAELLLGSPLDTPAAVTLGRVTGTALCSLGVACWLARRDVQSRAARGLVGAMVVYNLGVVIVLGSAGIRTQTSGVALWPAVVLHAAMAIWCIACLLRKPTATTDGSSE